MSAALLRLQIERSLEHRFPAALSPAPRTLETAPTGIRAVDDMLDGGLPAGAITEITGAQSSGRTSLALAFLARQTGEGRSCAWIDADDAFDPESAAASGIVLRQLLWVRCRGEAAEKGESGSGVPAGAKARSSIHRLCGPTEVVPWLQSLSPLSVSAGCDARVELAAFMRGLKPPPPFEESFSAAGEAPGRKKPWARLEQAIRATDLLLQASGFAALVLDLAGTAPEHARRIPLATWFRFRQAAARTRCSLVVLGQAACAQSSAAAVLECAPLAARGKSSTAGGSTVLDGFTFSLRRSRGDVAFRSAGGAGRKPPESAWAADCAWNAEKRA